jgi:ABC-2 type transport system ATP-binding protein
MIEVSHLTKRFGSLTAVDDLSFEVHPGRVTGFLGPNGAGKTTTLRIALGLVRATSGNVTFDGRRYAEMRKPMRQIGAALEASSFHPGRSGREHLKMLAPLVGVPDSRVDEVLGQVGLTDAAKKRVKGYSLGMRGRLGLAATLLGDPQVLLLDEPTNGLDPEGIAWMRGLLRHLAGEGRTILISSHLLSEVQQTVDDVVIIAQGKLVHASPLEELAKLSENRTLVVPADPQALMAVAREQRWPIQQAPDNPAGAHIIGPTAQQIGHACFAAGVELYQLATQQEGLEGTFLQLTSGQGGMR